MKTTEEEIKEFRINRLQKLLDERTKAQRNLFKRMYGTLDAKEMPDGKIDWAIRQCENSK